MLTKDAKTVLYELYKEYIVRRHNHISKSNAKDFISSDSIQENLFLVSHLLYFFDLFCPFLLYRCNIIIHHCYISVNRFFIKYCNAIFFVIYFVLERR